MKYTSDWVGVISEVGNFKILCALDINYCTA